MLPRMNRLRRDKDIERVFKYGRGYGEGFLFLKALENNLKVSRIAFVVGKRIAKQAVLRNTMKRRLRAIIRSRLPEIKISVDAVFVVSRRPIRSDDIKKTINKLLTKAKLI